MRSIVNFKLKTRRQYHLAFAGLALSSFLLTGCGSTGSISASGTEVPKENILKAEAEVKKQNIPLELQPHYLALYSEGPQNSVLHSMRGGLAALRLGLIDLGKRTFDQAIREVESMQAGAAQAERAKSKFVAEQEKWFKGESHERSALYFYRGLLYLQDQDFGNAAACFKRAQIQDITGDDAKDFAGDWCSAEIGLALATFKQGDTATAEAALARMTHYSTLQGDIPLPKATTNLLIVVEVGKGPIKYRAGKHGERLKYREEASRVKKVQAAIGAEKPIGGAAAENIFIQATTRGTRQIDSILGDKADFKEDTGNAAVGLAGGAVVASQVDKSGISSGILALAALGTAIASATTEAHADVRNWDNLPHSIFLIPLTVPSKCGEIIVQAYEGASEGSLLINSSVIPESSIPAKPDDFKVHWVKF